MYVYLKELGREYYAWDGRLARQSSPRFIVGGVEVKGSGLVGYVRY